MRQAAVAIMLLTASAAASAQSEPTVAEFLHRAEPLERQGPAAMLSPDYLELKQEVKTARNAVRDRLAAASIEIAHFKMTLAPDTGNDLAVLNLVRTGGTAESLYRLADDLTEGELVRGVVQVGVNALGFGPLMVGNSTEWAFEGARLEELRSVSAASGGQELLELSHAVDSGRRRPPPYGRPAPGHQGDSRRGPRPVRE